MANTKCQQNFGNANRHAKNFTQLAKHYKTLPVIDKNFTKNRKNRQISTVYPHN